MPLWNTQYAGMPGGMTPGTTGTGQNRMVGFSPGGDPTGISRMQPQPIPQYLGGNQQGQAFNPQASQRQEVPDLADHGIQWPNRPVMSPPALQPQQPTMPRPNVPGSPAPNLPPMPRPQFPQMMPMPGQMFPGQTPPIARMPPSMNAGMQANALERPSAPAGFAQQRQQRVDARNAEKTAGRMQRRQAAAPVAGQPRTGQQPPASAVPYGPTGPFIPKS